MFLFQRKYRPLLGLDITTSSVKLIKLAMAGGQYRVEAYAAEPTPQNAINEKAIVDADAGGAARRREERRGRDRDLGRCRHHQGDPDAALAAHRRPRGAGRDAGGSVHPLPD